MSIQATYQKSLKDKNPKLPPAKPVKYTMEKSGAQAAKDQNSTVANIGTGVAPA